MLWNFLHNNINSSCDVHALREVDLLERLAPRERLRCSVREVHAPREVHLRDRNERLSKTADSAEP